jgi:hypothetical protein
MGLAAPNTHDIGGSKLPSLGLVCPTEAIRQYDGGKVTRDGPCAWWASLPSAAEGIRSGECHYPVHLR